VPHEQAEELATVNSGDPFVNARNPQGIRRADGRAVRDPMNSSTLEHGGAEAVRCRRDDALLGYNSGDHSMVRSLYSRGTTTPDIG